MTDASANKQNYKTDHFIISAILGPTKNMQSQNIYDFNFPPQTNSTNMP